jgi:hypothetical protein
VLASGEFCNTQRRIAHLLTMYGFVIYLVTTIMMVFAYPTPAVPTPDSVTALWYIGSLMVCAGGYWFWFFIRVDVVAEGHSPFRFVRADLFVVSLTLSVTFALVWATVQATGNAAASSGRAEKIRRRIKACAALLNTRSASTQFDTEDKDTSCRPSFT